MTTLLVFLLVIGTIYSGEALYFEDGYDHHYTYSSESDILGLHNITTIIKFRIRSVNDTDGGTFLHQLMVDSFVQISEKGYVVDNPEHWQFTHKFFFTVGNDSVVSFVHFHPEEKNEVLTMKKVLASTLSVKRQEDDGDHWSFTSKEEDHAGDLEHEYEATRHSDGITFVRKHQSLQDVHRLHNKTVHLDLRGTPVHIDALDNITLRHTPSKVSSKTMDGFQEIEEEYSGEFPKIGSISRSKMKMTSKRKHNEWTNHSLRGMQKETLTVRQVLPEKVALQKVAKEIQSHLACVHSIENKYDRNRTECVHNLRKLIYSLKKEDFLNFGTKVLTRTCEEIDILCKDERNLFIDIIASEGSVEAQLMVLDLVMRRPNVSEDDLRRCLFHAIAITSPALEIVQHIEALCFGEDSRPGGN